MKTTKLLLAIFLLSPSLVWAQNNADENFRETVVNKVMAYNDEIDQLNADLKKARANQSADTVSIKQKKKETVSKCFQVPQDFIKANPSSPYSCQALGMLGDGSKNSPVSVADLERLFNSLAAELRNTEAGKAYAAQLEKWKERDKVK